MAETILKVKGVSKTFHSKKVSVRAVNNVSFEVTRGETVAFVGESGCGKTTLGHCIVRAVDVTSGEVIYIAEDGTEYDLHGLDKRTMKSIRRDIQMIFQDPFSSLDPRMTVFDIISEPLRANFRMKRSELEERVKDAAAKVGLNTSYLRRYPHAFSGGQRQRIGIARALVLYPRIIVCDEAVSALDVSVQAQVINLLKDLQNEFGFTYLFISHDLSAVEYISDRVGVMYLGKMVEFAATDRLFEQPLHPYTEALLSSVLIADPTVVMERIPLVGEMPDPTNPPTGCFFHTRCRYCMDICRTEDVQFIEEKPGHYVACHRIKELQLKGILAG
ncbi:MAG: ATP-binding cassette domain-containing protein [Limnochordia bacterium]|nr:ATP-binding cassette domain-containing protein [Limnochordia bacterium]